MKPTVWLALAALAAPLWTAGENPVVGKNLARSAEEHVTAYWASDDHTAMVVVSDYEGRRSRLVRIGPGPREEGIEIPEIGINSLQVLGESRRAAPRIFVKGAVGHDDNFTYVARIYDLDSNGPVIVWDSSELPLKPHSTVHVTADGRYWGALEQRGDWEIKIWRGTTESHELVRPMVFTHRGHVPDATSSDFPTFVLLDGELGQDELPIMALVWHGTVRVVGPGTTGATHSPGLKGIAQPMERDMIDAHWQTSTRTLWVSDSKGWTAYALPEGIAEVRHTYAMVGGAHIGKAELGFFPSHLRCLTDGSVIATAGAVPGTWLARVDVVAGEARLRGPVRKLPEQVVVPSPGGRAMLALPEFARGSAKQEVRIRPMEDLPPGGR